MKSYVKTAYSDIVAGLDDWRVWSMLAANDIRRRYRRSRIGQFWLTISMGVTIVSLGILYSRILGTDPSSYLPYVAVTFVVWGFISSNLLESCTSFNEGEGILRHMYMPRSLFVCRTIARNVVVLGHNAIIIPLTFLYFAKGPTMQLAWIVVGIALLVLNLFWMGLILSIIAIRFRDVPQIVASVTQLLFFVTPVIYQPEHLQGAARLVIYLNPFASMLEVVRDPLLGIAPSKLALAICTTMAVVGFAVALPFFGRYSKRVVYWL